MVILVLSKLLFGVVCFCCAHTVLDLIFVQIGFTFVPRLLRCVPSTGSKSMFRMSTRRSKLWFVGIGRFVVDCGWHYCGVDGNRRCWKSRTE